MITIPEFLKQHNLNKVDFLWLDLQGYELNVLKSASQIISDISAIYTEVSVEENYRGGALYPELKKWLNTKKFVVKSEKIAWKDGGNVLFVKK